MGTLVECYLDPSRAEGTVLFDVTPGTVFDLNALGFFVGAIFVEKSGIPGRILAGF